MKNIDDDGPIVEPSYKSWWGVPDMPKINYSCEDAGKWALDVTSFWIDNFNIDKKLFVNHGNHQFFLQ